jgi:hypothetical protein
LSEFFIQKASIINFRELRGFFPLSDFYKRIHHLLFQDYVTFCKIKHFIFAIIPAKLASFEKGKQLL